MKSGLILGEDEHLVVELEAELWATSSNPIARLIGGIIKFINLIFGNKRQGYVVITDKRVVEAEIKKAGDENALYTRAAKPYIDAKKLLTQAENYSRFEEIAAMYDDAKARHEEAMALAAAEAERQKQEEKAYAAELKAKRAAEKAQKKAQKKDKDK